MLERAASLALQRGDVTRAKELRLSLLRLLLRKNNEDL